MDDPAPVSRPAAWRWPAALAAAAGLFIPLNWLLARVIWLPLFFGVFFFLVAGLLVGAVAFRMARPLRPLGRGQILLGVALVTLASAASGITWEYRYVTQTAADPPRFNEVRATLQKQGKSIRDVEQWAATAFRDYLKTHHPPGSVMGYARWALSSGEARLTLQPGLSDLVTLGSHRRLGWAIRSAAAVALCALGLWIQLDSLRQATPITNILQPGQEAEDEE